MVAGGHRIDRRRCIEPRCIIVFQYSNLWAYSCTYTLTDNRTTSTVDRTGTAIELFNHITESVGSAKEPTNFLIYTACCCSASNLTFHAFNRLGPK